MPNSFSKEELVAFEDILEGFNDALVMSELVTKYDVGDVDLERASDTMWRPMPYIMNSYDGMDQSSNFNGKTQLSVPASVSHHKSAPFTMTAKELRDGLQENRLATAARQKLASDVNVALMNTASNGGTIVVKRTAGASGYDDIAECDAMMNMQGVQMDDRCIALSSRSYNDMAGNLAARETMNNKPTQAYERSYVGQVAGFDTFKLDYANRLTAAAGVTVTVNGANQRYIPKAIDLTVDGKINVDNRYQDLAITVTSGTVKVGDCFTIAGVNSVHKITKTDTGELQTFRVTKIVTGSGGTGTIQISPPIISADSSPTEAEKQYQNTDAAPADNAAVTWLNTASASINPFWHKSAIELLPARLILPSNAGLEYRTGTTDQGLTMIMAKQAEIDDLSVKYRFDVLFGTAMVQPEMAGIMLFSQS